MKYRFMFLMLACAATASAALYTAYQTTLVNEPAMTTNKTYVIDMNKAQPISGVARISAQAVYAVSGSTTAFAGPVTLQWVASNDGANFNPVNVSSITYAGGSNTPLSSLWDFGTVDYRYLKLVVVGPTAGALSLVVTVVGKN